MNRRTTRVLAAGACCLSLALTSCGVSQSNQASRTLNVNDLVVDTPPGAAGVDQINWNLPYEPLSLDWVYTFNYAENTVLANMCESLLRLNPNLTISPALADRVSNPTPTTWVYDIRPGVRFWDGHQLTAQDVAFSLNRNLDPKVGSYFSIYFDNVESITASGPLQVTVRLKRPDALFNQAMSTAAGVVAEKAYVQREGKAYGTSQGGVMCTGPFEFGSWESGDALTLVRNPHYWDPALAARSRRISFTFIADESTAVNALRSGAVDGEFFYLPPAGLVQLETSPTGTVSFGKSLAFWTLLAAGKSGPFSNPLVRQALLTAIDRPAIAKVVFQGAAIPARVLASPDYWGYARSTFQTAYDAASVPAPDLAKARQLLKRAGSPTGTITIGIQGSSAVHEQTAELLQAAGASIGLKITIKVIPVQQYGNLYNDPKARAGLDAFLSTWYGNFADPLDVYDLFVPGGSNNFNDYTGVAGLISTARSEQNGMKRADLVVQIQQKLTDDAVWLPLEYLPTILYQSNRLTGATASLAYLYYPWASAIGRK